MSRPAMSAAGGESAPRGPSLPSGRAIAVSVALAAVAIISLYGLLPTLAGLDDTWARLGRGEGFWLLAAGLFEVLSFASYVIFFRVVFGEGSIPIGWRRSYRITMAGVVATRLLATAGAGGIVLLAWALSRAGMAAREITDRAATFFVLLYGIYMAALIVGGMGLRLGIFSGPAPFGMTMVPAALGAAAIAVALVAWRRASALGRAADRVRSASGALSRASRALATVPATLRAGVSGSLALVRSRRTGLLGALGWWGFDIAVLTACLAAYGDAPGFAVVLMAYFVGMLANTLPVPGGIGAVDGGMIGALIAFGVPGGLAIVAVLTYRLFAFWLPIVPGVIAYAQLLREEPAAPGAG
ncbi:MAG: lysylphosphatidylglycerol synthase transmembrane domain-containing protein [Solirubrobacterales bacterium]